MDEDLKKYGRHLKSCELVRMPVLSGTDDFWKCTCGFSTALGCKICNGEGYVVEKSLPEGGFYTGHCPECGNI